MPSQDSEQARWFVDEVLPHEKELRAWLRARFPGAGDVDDLVQEAFARLLKAHVSISSGICATSVRPMRKKWIP